MTVQARIAVLHPDTKELVVESVQMPAPGPYEVLVEQSASGICHSQLDIIDRERTDPLVIGHESVGSVIATGAEVTRFTVGDQVLVTWLPRDPYADRKPTPAAVQLPDGRRASTHNVFTWATHALADEQYVVAAPSGTPGDVGSIIGCAVMTGAGAVLNSAPVEPGQTVAIWGVGGLGLSAVSAARNVGAAKVIAVDIADSKLTLAAAMGADELVNASTTDPVERIRALTKNDAGADGVDTAFDFTGRADNLARTIASVRPGIAGGNRGGRAVLVGAPRVPIELHTPELLHKERQLIGSLGGSSQPTRDFPIFVDWYRAGQLDLDALVTNRYTLDQVNEAVTDLRTGKVLGRAIFEF